MNTSPLHEPRLNRQFLSQRVATALQKLGTGEDKSILNFWGCPGGGRTTLLEDFKVKLLDDENVAVLGIWDVSAAPIEKIITDIQNALDDAATDKNKVILIDNLRALDANGSDDPIFLQFEQSLMATVVHRKDVLTLIISQHEIRQWHELVVRMRQVSYLIPSLSRHEFDKKAVEMGFDPLDVFARTLGHPLPLEWIKENQNIGTIEIDNRAATYFLKDLKKDIRTETRVLSLLINFDEALMEKVLKSIGLAQRKNYFALLETIRHMGFAGLINNDSRTGMYHFTDPSVRQLLARGYRNEHPDHHRKIQALLLAYYKEAATRPSTLQNFFVNVIYHMTLHAALNHQDASEQCQSWLSDTLPAWQQDVNWQAVQEVWLSGQGDEFVSVELAALLGQDMYEYVSQFIHTRMEEENGKAND